MKRKKKPTKTKRKPKPRALTVSACADRLIEHGWDLMIDAEVQLEYAMENMSHSEHQNAISLIKKANSIKRQLQKLSGEVQSMELSSEDKFRSLENEVKEREKEGKNHD